MAFKRGPQYYAQALRYYNDALRHIANAAPSEELTQLESVIHTNLAAIFLVRELHLLHA